MEQILHQLIGSVSHHLYVFFFRISSINSIGFTWFCKNLELNDSTYPEKKLVGLGTWKIYTLRIQVCPQEKDEPYNPVVGMGLGPSNLL